MAVVLNRHLLCFSNSGTRPTTITPPCSCLLHKTSFLSPKRKPFFSLISCSSSTSQSSEPNTQTAESCINLGLSLFSKGRVRDALVQFETALTLDPTPVEAQAALYNKACCHAYRALPEFKELQEEARLGAKDIGYSFRRDLKLISEVQAPFHGVRRFFYVALSAAAGISLFFTIPRLFHAINGEDGAPNLLETAGNAVINVGVGHRSLQQQT